MSLAILRTKLPVLDWRRAPGRREIERLLPDAKREREAKIALVERLEGERAELLVREHDAALKSLDQRIADERRETERADATVQLAEARIAASLELEPGRRERLDAVRDEIPAAERWLTDRYPKIAAELIKGMEMLRQVDGRIDAINGDLPAGVEPLRTVDAAIRGQKIPPLADTLILPHPKGDEVNLWPPNTAVGW